MKQKIRLTESDLHRIVKESVKNSLCEITDMYGNYKDGGNAEAWLGTNGAQKWYNFKNRKKIQNVRNRGFIENQDQVEKLCQNLAQLIHMDVYDIYNALKIDVNYGG